MPVYKIPSLSNDTIHFNVLDTKKKPIKEIEKSKTKTTYHFNNYKIVLPNTIGIDIHNHIDEYIKIDRRCKDEDFVVDKYVDIKLDFVNYFSFFEWKDGKIWTLGNVLEIKDKYLTFYYKNDNSFNKLIIPEDIYKNEPVIVLMYGEDYPDQLIILFRKENGPLLPTVPQFGKAICLSKQNLPSELDISNKYICSQFIYDKESYTNYKDILYKYRYVV